MAARTNPRFQVKTRIVLNVLEIQSLRHGTKWKQQSFFDFVCFSLCQAEMLGYDSQGRMVSSPPSGNALKTSLACKHYLFLPCCWRKAMGNWVVRVLLFFVFFGLVSVQLHPSSCRCFAMCFLRMYIIHLPRANQICFAWFPTIGKPTSMPRFATSSKGIAMDR